MKNLTSVELKAFIPARDFDWSAQFYEDMGFTRGWEGEGLAYFNHGQCSFLLQDFYEPDHANNFMMHLLVEDVGAWHARLTEENIAQKYRVSISELVTQPWGMVDFVLTDPSGVLWRIAQNV